MQEIEHAIHVLENNIAKINTVSEWGDHLGFSSHKYFSRQFRKHFGQRPKQIIVEKKLEMVKSRFAEFPDKINYAIAREIGLCDEPAFYKFIKRHTGKSPSEFKRECEKGV